MDGDLVLRCQRVAAIHLGEGGVVRQPQGEAEKQKAQHEEALPCGRPRRRSEQSLCLRTRRCRSTVSDPNSRFYLQAPGGDPLLTGIKKTAKKLT